jgi:hypothetical protein
VRSGIIRRKPFLQKLWRSGRIFKDSALQSYFNSKPWYHGSVDAEDFKETVFNEYEKANIDTIAKYEKSKGYR